MFRSFAGFQGATRTPKRNSSKREWPVVLVLMLLCTLIVTACGDNSTATPASSPTTLSTPASSVATANAGATTTLATTSAAAATTGAASTTGSEAPNTQSGTVRILYHNNPPTISGIKKVIEKFNLKYPNIKVDLSVVPTDQFDQVRDTRMAANDVDIVDGLVQIFTNAPQDYMKDVEKPKWQQWIEGGLLEDLTNQPFIKNWDPQAVKDATTYQGKVYSIVAARYVYTGLYYNKDIFEKNALKVPTTWNEFVSVCEALKSKGIAPMTVGGKDGWPVGLPTFGILLSLYPDEQALLKGLWTGQAKYTDAKSLQFFDRGAKFLSYYENGITGIDTLSAPGRFASGKAAMLPTGTWDGEQIAKANPNLKFDYMPLPGSDNAEDNKYLGGKYDEPYLLMAKSPNKAAALKWLEFFSSPDMYKEYVAITGGIPTQLNVTTVADYNKTLVANLANFKLEWNNFVASPKGVGKYGAFNITNLVPYGDVNDPKELAQKAQTDWDAALRK